MHPEETTPTPALTAAEVARRDYLNTMGATLGLGEQFVEALQRVGQHIGRGEGGREVSIAITQAQTACLWLQEAARKVG